MYSIYCAYDPKYKAWHLPFVVPTSEKPHVIREFDNGEHTSGTQLFDLGNLDLSDGSQPIIHDFGFSGKPVLLSTKPELQKELDI